MSFSVNPHVSVIIPTYNSANYLYHALKSVIEQTYTNWEAIVVDNHSNDNTDDIVKGFHDDRINLYEIHNEGVISASRNLGIRVAKGEWIAFLDSDDGWFKDKLSIVVSQLDGCDFIFHDLNIIYEKKKKIYQPKKIQGRQVRSPVQTDLLINGSPIANSSVVVRKRLLERIGGIDESPEMVGCEDYNAWLRIAGVTERFFYLPKSLGYYTEHETNYSKKGMYKPFVCAVKEFETTLRKKELARLRSYYTYMSVRGKYANSRKEVDLKDLIYCVFHGRLEIIIKSLYMIFGLILRKN